MNRPQQQRLLDPLHYSSPYIPGTLFPHKRPTRQLSTTPHYNQDEEEAIIYIHNPSQEYRFTIATPLLDMPKDQVIWYCCPMEFYTPAATGFGQLNINQVKNLCYNHIQMFETILYLSQACWKNKTDCGPQKVTLVAASVVADKTDINNKIQNYSSIIFRLVKRGGTRFVNMLYTALLYNEAIQAMHSTSLMPLSIEDDLDRGNDDSKKKSRDKPPVDPTRLSAFRQLTRKRWDELCISMFNIPDQYVKVFTDNTLGIIDPEKILLLSHALVRTRRSSVPPRLDMVTNDAYVVMYEHKELAYKFPYGGRFAYMLDPEEFTMHNYHEFFFPHLNDNDSQTRDRHELDVYKRLNNDERVPIPSSMLPYHKVNIGQDEEGNEILYEDDSLLSDQQVALRDMQVSDQRPNLTSVYFNKVSKFPNPVALYDESVFRSNTLNRYKIAADYLNQHYADHPADDRLNKARVFMANAQAQACEEWEAHLGTVDANVPPSLRAINAWAINFRKTHFNMCMTRPHKNMNLSPLADLLVTMKMGIETLGKVYVLHDQIMLVYLSSLELYLGLKNHCHTLLMGDPRLGKSFVFEAAIELFIRGTSKALAFMTPKALTGEGADANDPNHDKISDKEIKFFEEMSADSLGVAKAGAFGGTAANTLTATEQMWRIWLSTGIIENHEMVRGEGERRVQVSKPIYARSVVHGACNFVEDAMSKPSASRWAIRRIMATEREGHGGVLTTIQRTLNEREKIHRADFIKRTQHLHWACAKTGSMIEGQVFPEGIDMTAANIMIALIGIHGPGFGLSNLSDIRHLMRVRSIVQSLVMTTANELLYNSELSPLRGRPADTLHTCLLKLYLTSNVEQVVIAFGILASQFENPIVPSAVKALFAFCRPPPEHVTADRDVGSSHPPKSRGVRQGDVASMIIQRNERDAQRFAQVLDEEDAAAGSSRSTANLLPDATFYHDKVGWDALKYVSPHKSDKESCIHALARTLLHSIKNMNPRPSQLDLENALRDLSETNLLVSDTTPLHGPPISKRLPILVIDSTMLRLLKDGKSLIGSNKKSGLKSCFEYILNYKGARKRDILYGASIPNLPYTYDVISVNPQKDAHTLIVPQPNFFEREVVAYTEEMNRLTNLNQLDSTLRLPKIDWAEAFTEENRYQPSPHFKMTMDIDDLANGLFNVNSNFSSKELAMKPSNNIFQHQQDLMTYSKRDPTQTLPYPTNLPPYHKEEYQQLQKQQHEHPVLTAHDLIKLAKQKLLFRYEPPSSHLVSLSVEEEEESKRREILSQTPFNKTTLCELANEEDATSILVVPLLVHVEGKEEEEEEPQQRRFLSLSDMQKREDGTWTTYLASEEPERKYQEALLARYVANEEPEEEQEQENRDKRKRGGTSSSSSSSGKRSKKHRQPLSERSLNARD